LSLLYPPNSFPPGVRIIRPGVEPTKVSGQVAVWTYRFKNGARASAHYCAPEANHLMYLAFGEQYAPFYPFFHAKLICHANARLTQAECVARMEERFRKMGVILIGP